MKAFVILLAVVSCCPVFQLAWSLLFPNCALPFHVTLPLKILVCHLQPIQLCLVLQDPAKFSPSALSFQITQP